MRTTVSLFAGVALMATSADAACRAESQGDARYVVCEFDPRTDDMRLFLNGATGAPYGEFDLVRAALEENGETLVFAMNAGMYHKDRTPVGLYIENGEQFQKLSTRDGPGNFHLKPNGVFWIWTEDGARGAHVGDTDTYQNAAHDVVAFATQSGPMLVIDGALHPKFLTDATSRKRRNGVGVRDDGAVVFALSDTAVTFHEFARFFRDTADCPNALYLDGAISRVFSADLGRNDPGLRMGPIVGVVKKAD